MRARPTARPEVRSAGADASIAPILRHRHAGVVSFILILPILEMFVLGYATAGGINDLPAAVVDGDRSAASRRLIQAIHQARSFEVVALPETSAQAERLLDEGKVSAAFIIPQGFERADGGVTIAAIIDGSNTAVASYAATYAEGVVGHFTAQAFDGQIAPVGAETRIWYNQELRRENFYIPALLGTMMSRVSPAECNIHRAVECIVLYLVRQDIPDLVAFPRMSFAPRREKVNINTRLGWTPDVRML